MRQRLSSLYEGLRHFIEGDDLWHALCIWQDNYGAASTFELKEYLNQIAPLLPSEIQRTKVHRKLVQSLLMNGSIAHFDPLPSMNDFRINHGLEVPAIQQEVAIPSAIASFIAFYLEIRKQLTTEHADRLHGKLVWLTEQNGMSDEFQSYLATIHDAEPCLAYITDAPGSLTPLLDTCYELLCEWLGPVEADKRFVMALSKSKQKADFELQALL
ncbi:MAG: hypothetical protein MI867_29795 [Pseudomonadales bacterium]|nr:hypothetical protein [Pseudomonadales bacterium]